VKLGSAHHGTDKRLKKEQSFFVGYTLRKPELENLTALYKKKLTII